MKLNDMINSLSTYANNFFNNIVPGKGQDSLSRKVYTSFTSTMSQMVKITQEAPKKIAERANREFTWIKRDLTNLGENAVKGAKYMQNEVAGAAFYTKEIARMMAEDAVEKVANFVLMN